MGFQAIMTGEVETEAIQLQSMAPQNSAEQTLLDVLSLLYTNGADLSRLNTEEAERLREIALRCPLDDGFGVYMARSALLKLDTLPRNYHNDCELLQRSEGQLNKTHISEDENEFSMYPNPNNGSWTMNLPLNDEETAVIDVFDMLGQRVFSEQINRTGLRNLEPHDMLNGVYTVRVLVNTEMRFSGKLTILR